MICEKWFSTPIWHTTLTDISDQQYQTMFEYCMLLSKQDPGVKISNKGGWQSQSMSVDMFHNTPLVSVWPQLQSALTKAYIEMGVPNDSVDAAVPGRITDVWVNINKKGDSNVKHTHPNAFISGVFYITDTTSKIIFERTTGVDTFVIDSMNSTTSTELSWTEVSYKPSKGILILFPSWLTHRVEPNLEDSPRISLAFNSRSYY